MNSLQYAVTHEFEEGQVLVYKVYNQAMKKYYLHIFLPKGRGVWEIVQPYDRTEDVEQAFNRLKDKKFIHDFIKKEL
ncbi:hypothetical protein [Ornithobacterium rhinotracheale]|uniref:hypothetical protein n=1 Tax=Ornithobacterium rhinotracheale TaxID=28251 RepID=UPI001FF12292|nr:hypothetical protein [Ornithobacterium rhinotracheale]MCK0199130.1 hypothetical protein [Ornithobacterium rhinotracheale]